MNMPQATRLDFIIPEPTRDALVLVARERAAQDAKWNRTPGLWECSNPLKLTVLAEEFGEVARAILEKEGKDRLRAELIQVAAVAVAWAESINETVGSDAR